MVSVGVAPAVPVATSKERRASGIRPLISGTDLAKRGSFMFSCFLSLEGEGGKLKIRPQIHPRIKMRDLLTIPVEHQRRPTSSIRADAAFGCLAPARMVDLRVHVRVEAVLA